MAVQLIAFPFQLNKDRTVTTQDDDSDDYYAAELALLSLTHVGERELVPDYGITEPTFGEFDEVEFVSQVSVFGPPVTIQYVEAEWVSDGEMEVTIEFDSGDDFDGTSFTDTDGEEEFELSEGA